MQPGEAICRRPDAVAQLVRGDDDGIAGHSQQERRRLDPDHPWARLSSGERMVSKADSCTYRLYDELLEQLR